MPKVKQVGTALQLAAAAALYGVPWTIARSCRLAQRAYRFAVAAVSLGWKDGLNESA